MVIGAADGRVLMVHQAYGAEFYGLPGGVVDPGETPAEAVVREVREETGLVVTAGPCAAVVDLVSADGVRYRGHVFLPGDVMGTPSVQDPTEIRAVGWWPLDALPSPLTPSATAALAGLR